MARRPLERERVRLDGGRRTKQLMRDSLGGLHIMNRARHLTLAIPVTLVACHLDRLANEPPRPVPPLAQVAPVIDSASLGTTVPRVDHVALRNLGAGQVQWIAHVKNRAPWLALGDSTGFAPDSIGLTFDPTGLGVGAYRDTIIIATTANSAILALPVEFRILP